MTPEERFEQIEATLNRIATESEIGYAKSEARMTRLETDLTLLQDFMADSFRRSEERLDRIEELLERHISDGHGGEPKKKPPRRKK